MMVVAGGIFVSKHLNSLQQSQFFFFFHVIVDICSSVQVVTASVFGLIQLPVLHWM